MSLPPGMMQRPPDDSEHYDSKITSPRLPFPWVTVHQSRCAKPSVAVGQSLQDRNAQSTSSRRPSLFHEADPSLIPRVPSRLQRQNRDMVHPRPRRLSVITRRKLLRRAANKTLRR
ncbi:hypothetical protein IG631_06229 [Alternaria alternata]|nr:hypothetical protein IG631_06229 [Alternaria alternata]